MRYCIVRSAVLVAILLAFPVIALTALVTALSGYAIVAWRQRGV